MQAENCMAEVVSLHEYLYARKIGFPCDRIIFNGVAPAPMAKYECALGGGIVNVDSYDEYKEISAIAAVKTKIKLGVRVNIDVGNGVTSRFGVDVMSSDLCKLMEEMCNDPYVTFSGFHVHIGSAREPLYWRAKIVKMIELAQEFNADYIDLGGGLYGTMPDELACQFKGYPGSFNEYFDFIGSAMKKAFPDENVKLIVEPGTALVGNAFMVATTVTGIKNVRGKTFITVDCNSNALGVICDIKDIPYRIVHTGLNTPVEVTDADICGNTCLEFDYIRRHVNCDVAIGDYVFFDNVGAYSISSSRQFIVPRMAVVDADTGEVLRQAENTLDMFYMYL